MRTPPHNLQAEQSLLGAMLLSRDAIDAGAAVLSPEAFYKPAHGHVFAAILALHGRGEPADPVTVAEELKRAGVLDQAGGAGTLTDLQAGTPSTTNAGRYAAIVDDAHRLRRLIGVASEIAEIGYSTPDDVAGAVDRAEGMLFALSDVRTRRMVAHLGSSLDGWLAELARRKETGELSGVPTGWHDLDAMLLGLQPGQLITVAGRPGMGKSLLAAALTRNVAVADCPCLLVSVEMSLAELQGRYMAAEAQIPLQSIRSAQVTPRDWERLGGALTRLRHVPLWVDDDPAANLVSIRAAARRVANKGGLSLIVVDYTQIVSSLGKHQNREGEVAEISRGLKRLAGDMAVPVVALAQLNRNVEQRSDKRPMLSDLRETGALENDSDVVVFLYRDEYYRPDSEDKGILELIVGKQRNGPTGTVRLDYTAERGRIDNLAGAYI